MELVIIVSTNKNGISNEKRLRMMNVVNFNVWDVTVQVVKINTDQESLQKSSFRRSKSVCER